MAKRKQLWHPDEVKQKIQASQLINRLNEHIYSSVPIMDSTQVNAALKLLGKVLPDLSAVQMEHSGEIETTSREQREAAVAAAILAAQADSEDKRVH